MAKKLRKPANPPSIFHPPPFKRWGGPKTADVLEKEDKEEEGSTIAASSMVDEEAKA